MRRFGVTSVLLPDLVSHVTPHISADCSTQMTSSVVSVIMSALPLHPAIEGKFIYPADSLFRSPN